MFTEAVQPWRDALQLHLWDRIGWKAKPTKPKLPPAAKSGMDGGGAAGDDIKALKAQLGKVVGIHSIEEWEAAMELSKEVPVVVDFTAVWCVRPSRHRASPRLASRRLTLASRAVRSSGAGRARRSRPFSAS